MLPDLYLKRNRNESLKKLINNNKVPKLIIYKRNIDDIIFDAVTKDEYRFKEILYKFNTITSLILPPNSP